MKTLATHPELVRAWLLAQAGMPLPGQPGQPERRRSPRRPPAGALPPARPGRR